MAEKYEARPHWIDNASSNSINSEMIPAHATVIQIETRKVLTQYVDKKFPRNETSYHLSQHNYFKIKLPEIKFKIDTNAAPCRRSIYEKSCNSCTMDPVDLNKIPDRNIIILDSELIFSWPINSLFSILYTDLWCLDDSANYKEKHYLFNVICDITQFFVTVPIFGCTSTIITQHFMQYDLMKFG